MVETKDDSADKTTNIVTDKSVTKPPSNEVFAYLERDKLWFNSGSAILELILKCSTKVHIDMPAETEEYLKNNSRVIYTPLHKSMLETAILPHILTKKGFEAPYMVAGDNLFEKNYMNTFLKKIGTVICDRDKAKRLHSAEILLGQTTKILEDNHPVVMFPEGTRSRTGKIGTFMNTAYQAAIDAKAAVICVNFDYYQISDEKILTDNSTLYSFRISHLLNGTFKKARETYISFSKPLIMVENRKKLSKMALEECMNLVKIQPRNIVANAIINADNSGNNTILDILYHTELIREKIFIPEYENKLIGMTLEDSAFDLYKKANLENKNPKAIQLYAGYINHYLNK